MLTPYLLSLAPSPTPDQVLTPFCDETEWEENVKDKSKAEALAGQEEDEKCATPVAAKTLCIPFEQPPLPEGTPGSPTLTLTLALALTLT